MTPQERSHLIDLIAALPDQIEAAVSALPPEKRSARSGDEGWTVDQVLHHLADAQMIAFLRCKWIVVEDNPLLKTFEQEPWAETADAQEVDGAASLAIIRGVHIRWAALLRSLPEEAFTRTGQHPQYGEITLDFVVQYFADHGAVHVQQIREIGD